jgi:hypothetical protein
MKILFLDIDGVLNNPGTWDVCGALRRSQEDGLLHVPVDPVCVARFNRLVRESRAKVVISSSWRLHARWQDLGPALLREGVVAEIIGQTPCLANEASWLEEWRTRAGAPLAYERLERGMEIAEWLVDHRSEVEEFVILDDCSDMWKLKPWFVHTDGSVGLDDPDIERALWLLPQSRGADVRSALEEAGMP